MAIKLLVVVVEIINVILTYEELTGKNMSTTTMPEYTRKLMEIWDNRDKHGFHELVEIIESEKKKAHRFGVFDAIHMIALDHGWEESEAFYVKMAKEKLLSDTQKETKP